MADHPALDRRIYGADTTSIDANAVTVTSCEANRTIVSKDRLKGIINRKQGAGSIRLQSSSDPSHNRSWQINLVQAEVIISLFNIINSLALIVLEQGHRNQHISELRCLIKLLCGSILNQILLAKLLDPSVGEIKIAVVLESFVQLMPFAFVKPI